MLDSQENSILDMVARQQDAWNRGDAAAYSVDFDEQGTFTNIIGDTQFGREAFESRHAQIFATIFRGSTLTLQVRRIHFPSPDIALVDLDTRLSGYQTLPPGVLPPSDGILHTRLLQVFIRQDQQWRVAAYHNVDLKLAR